MKFAKKKLNSAEVIDTLFLIQLAQINRRCYNLAQRIKWSNPSFSFAINETV
jgi:hypothetical protein